MDFQSFEFHPRIAAGIQRAGYTTPTPIQLQAIPPALAGSDLVGLARTGTGKTAAFVLPLLQRLIVGPRGRVRALILAPTRELAEQTHQTIGLLGRDAKLRSLTLYGGVSIRPQIAGLRAGAEIIVACPGRLLDHINQGTIDLSPLEVLVLDEADRMLDMGFLPDIRRILKVLPAKRQTLLFSATMPAEIQSLARDLLRQPTIVQVDPIAPAETVSHALYPVPAHLKTGLLLELLRKTDSQAVLVFTRTKHRAERVAGELRKSGFGVASLQGNLSQTRRQAALDGFRRGTYQILVATDIAARGIDVTRISHVVNYDIPDTVDAYTHRIGRTGRMARTGDALTLVTQEDANMIRSIERALGKRIERRKLPDFDYATPDSKSQAPNRTPRLAPVEDSRPTAPARRPQRSRPVARRVAVGRAG